MKKIMISATALAVVILVSACAPSPQKECPAPPGLLKTGTHSLGKERTIGYVAVVQETETFQRTRNITNPGICSKKNHCSASRTQVTRAVAQKTATKEVIAKSATKSAERNQGNSVAEAVPTKTVAHRKSVLSKDCSHCDLAGTECSHDPYRPQYDFAVIPGLCQP